MVVQKIHEPKHKVVPRHFGNMFSIVLESHAKNLGDEFVHLIYPCNIEYITPVAGLTRLISSSHS